MSNESATQAVEEKFQIEIEAKEGFTSVAQQNIMTSTNLCHLFGKFFSVYDDFEGLRADVNSFGTVTLTAFFKHYDFPSNALTAFSKEINKKEAANEGLERIRRQRKIREDGVRFYLTKEGKEGMEDFIAVRNNKGKVDWNRVSADIANPSSTFSVPEVMSVVNAIDPTKLLRECYGATDENGNEYEYQINVISSKPSAGPNKEYIFSVMRINKNELDRAARDTGIFVGNALGIIK